MTMPKLTDGTAPMALAVVGGPEETHTNQSKNEARENVKKVLTFFYLQ